LSYWEGGEGSSYYRHSLAFPRYWLYTLPLADLAESPSFGVQLYIEFSENCLSRVGQLCFEP